jgi:NAD(P)-dependent dehydrogenase (short-subunit alcohol dehydrogenase family)
MIPETPSARNVVVTGGEQGLGLACAKALAEDAATVSILDVNVDRAGAAAHALVAMGVPATAFECDVTSGKSVRDAFAAVFDAVGDVHVLVNNAGIPGFARTEEAPEEQWDAIVDTSLKGTFLCSQQVGGRLIASGSGGAIVNISSVLGVMPMPTRAAYASAKAGIIALTKVTSGEWARHGIRVNAVAPGYLMTDVLKAGLHNKSIDVEAMTRWVPQGRIGEPEEAAAAVRFLASDAASFVTGSTLVIDGGYTSYGAWWEPSRARDAPFDPFGTTSQQ